MSKVSVDICIPSYRPDFFKQALTSALSQTYEFCRVFVSDNCPTEEIHEIVKSFRSEKIFYRRSSLLSVDNYLASFQMGDGQLIKPLFDDDILHPFCVERFVKNFMNQRSSTNNAYFAFSCSGMIDTENYVYQRRRAFDSDRLIAGTDFRAMCVGNLLNFVGEFSTVVFSRHLLSCILRRASNPFFYAGVDGRSGLPDVCFYLNASEECGISFVGEELSYFRRADNHDSDSNPNGKSELQMSPLSTNWFDLFRGIESQGEILPRNIDRINFFISKTERKFPGSIEVAKSCTDFRRYFVAGG